MDVDAKSWVEKEKQEQSFGISKAHCNKTSKKKMPEEIQSKMTFHRRKKL